MVEQSSNNKNLNKLISSSPYISNNELRKEVKKNKSGEKKVPEMENKERGRKVEERSIWCPVSSLVLRFFFFLQRMCCPKSPPMHVLPGFPLQCMCCPVFLSSAWAARFPSSPLAAAHFLSSRFSFPYFFFYPKTPPPICCHLPSLIIFFSYHFLFPPPISQLLPSSPIQSHPLF